MRPFSHSLVVDHNARIRSPITLTGEVSGNVHYEKGNRTGSGGGVPRGGYDSLGTHFENFGPGTVSSHVSYRRLLIARDLLCTRYDEPLRLAELAAAAGLSDFHFLRSYRAAFGETPHQHLTRVRLDHAKRSLARGAAVTDVCFDVGYSSLGSFSALFARETGRSPRAWQREVRAVISVPEELGRLYMPPCFIAFFVDPRPERVESDAHQ
jgi:AraC-like DNA-binding protein